MKYSWLLLLFVSLAASGKTIHLYGDSIFRGYALGAFADEISVHTLDPIASPCAMMNSVFADSWIQDRCVYNGTPDADTIHADWKSGHIRRGDLIVLEDAGDHGNDPAAYRALWEDWKQAAEQYPITVFIQTTADMTSNPAMQFDRVIDGTTMNNVIREVAESAILVDIDKWLTVWELSARAIDGVEVFHDDGVHPGAWSQLLMVGELLAAFRYPYIRGDTLRALMIQHRDEFNSPLTVSRSGAYFDHCLWR